MTKHTKDARVRARGVMIHAKRLALPMFCGGGGGWKKKKWACCRCGLRVIVVVVVVVVELRDTKQGLADVTQRAHGLSTG